jgi:protein TonB
MKKILSICTLAGIISFGLFAFMAFLISNDGVVKTAVSPPVNFDVVQVPEDTKPAPIVRKQLQPPEPPPIMEVSKVTPVITEVNSTFDYNHSKPSFEDSNGDDFIMKSPPNHDARPIVRVNPKYPITALREGVQGWVKLAFDISAIGQVINVKVIDSEPKRIFDKAAKQALKKWKYRAKSIDGKKVQQKNFTVQLDFTMEKQI